MLGFNKLLLHSGPGVALWSFIICILVALLSGSGAGFFVAVRYEAIAERVNDAIKRRDASVRPSHITNISLRLETAPQCPLSDSDVLPRPRVGACQPGGYVTPLIRQSRLFPHPYPNVFLIIAAEIRCNCIQIGLSSKIIPADARIWRTFRTLWVM